MLDHAGTLPAAARPHQVDLALQQREIAAAARGDDARRLLLERAAHRVDLAQALAHHLRDIGAAARNVGDQPGRLELAQRLAHRPLAGAELLGDPQLHQPLAGVVVAAEDAPQQRFLQPLAQRRVDEVARPSPRCGSILRGSFMPRTVRSRARRSSPQSIRASVDKGILIYR